MPGDLPTSPDLAWTGDGVPVSRLYDDVYFSKSGGLEESRAVFLQGCGLPAAWTGRRSFCVAELGLGTGRNIAALLDLWSRTAPAGARLSIFSVEGHPMTAAEATRALQAWPQIGAAARALIERWPSAARGFHRIDLTEFAATLDVAIMEAGEALAVWSGEADAWFLDGFAPAKNPAMWWPELMALVKERSAPGARAATYTVARTVREALAAQGFAVTKASGVGTKRERLEAVLPGARRETPAPAQVAIVGAGIAGAALARAFAAVGIGARVFDVAGRPSGPPAALVAPRLDAGLGVAASLFAQAARRASALYGALPGAVISRGVVQIEAGEKDAGRFETIAGSDLFAPGAIGRLSTQEVAQWVGEAAKSGGLMLSGALVVAPDAILSAWAPEVVTARIERLEQGWRLMGPDGEFEAEVVCLAAGMGSAALAAGLGLLPVRGQASFARGVAAPAAALFGAYVAPAPGGVMFGATHQRGDTLADVREADTAANLAAVGRVLPKLARRLAAAPLSGWAGVRATTRDFLPLAGRIGGGLFVLSGLGSRGFCLAPLLAEHIAALALGAPSPLPSGAAELVSPERFARRERRRRGEIPVKGDPP